MTGLPLVVALVITAAPLPEAKPDKDKIEALIAQLRSANKEPHVKITNYPGIVNDFIELPKDYDEKAQEVVRNARSQLEEIGDEAFPFLIAHRNDKEYSLSIEQCKWEPFSVGDVCLMILERHVASVSTIYKPRFDTCHFAEGYSYRVDSRLREVRIALRKWYDEHKSCKLREMQIERVEWAIAQEKAIGFPDARDKEQYLVPLERRLDELKKR